MWSLIRRALLGLVFGIWLIVPYSWGGFQLALFNWPSHPFTVTAIVAVALIVLSLMLTVGSVSLFRLLSTFFLAVDLGLGIYAAREAGWVTNALPVWLWIAAAVIVLVVWLPIATALWQGYHRSRSVSNVDGPVEHHQ